MSEKIIFTIPVMKSSNVVTIPVVEYFVDVVAVVVGVVVVDKLIEVHC